MPRYLVKRSVRDDVEAERVGNRHRAAASSDDLGHVAWEHSHVVVDDAGNRIVYGVFRAPSAECLQERAEATDGHVDGEVLEIGGDVRPEDFAGDHDPIPRPGDPSVRRPGSASTDRYLIVRRWRSLAVAEDYVERMRATGAPEAVRWDHTHVSEDDSGQLTSFCVYEAPSADVLRDHIVPLGGFQLVGIHPIRAELAPDRGAAAPGPPH